MYHIIYVIIFPKIFTTDRAVSYKWFSEKEGSIIDDTAILTRKAITNFKT